MLEAIDTLSTLFTSPDTARLATFAHDVIYQPERSDNEARSAAWMRENLASSALSPALLDGAEKMVLATKYHRRYRWIRTWTCWWTSTCPFLASHGTSTRRTPPA